MNVLPVEIDGFREGVKHIRNFHPDTLVSDKACPCILCPKRFARMDHLKNHLYSHVNRVRPGIAKHNLSTFVRSSTSRSSLKHRLFGQDLDADNSDEESDEEFENWTQNRDFKDFIYLKCDEDIPSDADWSSKILLTCFICQKSCDGFHMAASHMKHIHPGETEKCPICGKGFTKIDQLKNHVWRHVNKVFPGTPKHPEMNTNNLGRGKNFLLKFWLLCSLKYANSVNFPSFLTSCVRSLSNHQSPATLEHNCILKTSQYFYIFGIFPAHFARKEKKN